MAITVDYITKIILVPKTYLTLVSGTLYELDTNQFRLDLADIQDNEAGIWADTMFTHNTAVTVAGTTFARVIEIINGYSVEFENGAYSVRLAESNNNIFDVENGILVQNTVQVIGQNSAGLVQITSAAYPTSQQIRDAMDTATTGGKASVDDKLDSNFAISAAGI